MEKPAKLSDAQLVILNAAAAREDGVAIPPASEAMGEAARSAVAKALVRRGLVEAFPIPAGMPEAAWKGPGAALRITPAGFAALGVDEAQRPAWARPAAPAAEPEAVSIADLTPETHPVAAANAASWPSGPAKGGKRKAAEEAAARGEMPAPPDFTAGTHKPYRAKLAKLIALAEAGDAAGLRAFPINPVSTSPRALARFRDLAVAALEARAKA
jgi:hypothetical protein